MITLFSHKPLVEAVELADIIDPEKALLKVKETGPGNYEVRAEGCRIVNYSKRPFTGGLLKEERYCNEMEDRVVLVRKGPVSDPTTVTIFFKQKS